MGVMLGLALVCPSQSAWADSFDAGLGLGFVNSTDSSGFEGGWDFQAGYEKTASDDWNFGGQVHLVRGWTDQSKVATDMYDDTSMYFQSMALCATARPEIKWLQWLQFKGGVVFANYKTLAMEGSGLGVAAGAGVVIGGESFQIHILDFQRYIVAGHNFDIYSISLAVFFTNHR